DSNGAMTVQSTVCNQGTTGSNPSDLRIYASADTTITGTFSNPYSPDYFLGMRPVAALSPGQCDTQNTNLNVPGIPSAEYYLGARSVPSLTAGQCSTGNTVVSAGLQQGEWYLGAISDESNSVHELAESNNTLTGNKFGFGNGPDFYITAISPPPYSRPGYNFN